MNIMKITIEGTTKVGKSTLARLIERTLRDNGIEAIMEVDMDYSSIDEKRAIIDASMEERINAKTKDAISRIQKKLGKLSREAGVLPLTRFGRKGIAGSSCHGGSTFPMRDRPTGLESDTLGRPAGLQRVFVVDASVLPSIPATTITLSVMANAHRIATESAHVSA